MISGGRVCLSTLNKPPKGTWSPSVNIITVLASIQVLMSDPYPDDPLVAEIVKINVIRLIETGCRIQNEHCKIPSKGKGVDKKVCS